MTTEIINNREVPSFEEADNILKTFAKMAAKYDKELRLTVVSQMVVLYIFRVSCFADIFPETEYEGEEDKHKYGRQNYENNRRHLWEMVLSEYRIASERRNKEIEEGAAQLWKDMDVDRFLLNTKEEMDECTKEANERCTKKYPQEEPQC